MATSESAGRAEEAFPNIGRTDRIPSDNGLEAFLHDCTLLGLNNAYAISWKDLINEIALYVDQYHIYIRYNPLSDLSKYIPLSPIKNHLDRFQKDRLIDPSGKPDNVHLHPVGVHYIPVCDYFRKLGEKHYRRVKRQVQSDGIRFDLMHAHFTWPQGYTGLRLKEDYGVPLVLTAHGFDIYELPFQDDAWRESITRVLNAADYIITVSRRNLGCIEHLDVDTPVAVIPNGFSESKFYPMDPVKCRRMLDLPQDKKIVFTAGNLVEVKGHAYLIEAMERVVRERSDVLCVIVGDGLLRDHLRALIQEKRLEDHVFLAGRQPHHRIPIWMNACDLFVLPSLSEGNPMVLFETMGCGKPFIGSAVGGIPEVIQSEDHGMLMEPKNSEQMAAVILKALDKRWNTEEILQYARQFTWKSIARKTATIYRKCLS
ncbi:MAG: glycosyltransferase [Methanomicrobiales archaeon]|nr:glycosyltransferase [Methanomicrobiales archaeon]